MYYENLKLGQIIQYEEDPNRVLLVLSQKNKEEYKALIIGTNEVIQIESGVPELEYV